LNTTKRVLFVISEINNEKMISFITEIPQIHSIYIFRHNGVLIKDQGLSNIPKIKKIFTDIVSIIILLNL